MTDHWHDHQPPEIIAVTGKGFPASLSNALRVSHYQQDFDWVQADSRWALPVGKSVYFRAYGPPEGKP